MGNIRPFHHALILALVLAWTGGCRSSKRQQPVYVVPPAYLQTPGAGQSQGQPQLVVFFHGAFAYPAIPWEEGLRLAEAMLLAEYQGSREPFEISILRRGQAYRVPASRLLRGQENPLLEPGDIIEILR